MKTETVIPFLIGVFTGFVVFTVLYIINCEIA